MLNTQRRNFPLFFSSNAASSVTGTTNETSLGSVILPKGIMMANGSVEIWSLWLMTSNANNKTLKINFGATAVYTQTLAGVGNAIQNRAVRISNRNSQSSQLFYAIADDVGFGIQNAALSTSAEDTSANVTVDFRGQLGTSSDTITLAGAIIILTPSV